MKWGERLKEFCMVVSVSKNISLFLPNHLSLKEATKIMENYLRNCKEIKKQPNLNPQIDFFKEFQAVIVVSFFVGNPVVV